MQRNTGRSLWWGQVVEWALGYWGSKVLFSEALSWGNPAQPLLVGSGGVVLHWAVKLHQANLFLTCCGCPAGLSLTLRDYGWD